jgi:hypothetical protein
MNAADKRMSAGRVAVVLLLLFFEACGQPPVAPATNTLPSTTATETFTGGIQIAFGTNFHFFSTSQRGAIYVQVAQMEPNRGVIFVGVGVPSPTGCLVLAKAVLKPAKTIGVQLPDQAAGDYCLAAEGNSDSIIPFTYTIYVWHS